MRNCKQPVAPGPSRSGDRAESEATDRTHVTKVDELKRSEAEPGLARRPQRKPRAVGREGPGVDRVEHFQSRPAKRPQRARVEARELRVEPLPDDAVYRPRALRRRI